MTVRNRSTAGPPTSTTISSVMGVPGPPGPPGVSGFVAAGDLDGSATSQNVRKVQNVPVKPGTPNDAQVLTYVTANSRWEAQDSSAQAIVKPLGPNSTWTGHYYIAAVSGNDGNNGTSSGTAFKTWRHFMSVLGTLSPELTGSLTVTFTESQPDDTDQVFFTPLMANGGKCYIEGVPALIATGTFATVTPKSMSVADGRWRADLGGGASGHLATKGLRLVNTTRGNSVSGIQETISGTAVAFTQPYDEKAVVSPTLPNTEPSYRNDWVAGDSWSLYQLPSVYIAQYQPTTAEATSSFVFSFCVLQKVYIPDLSGTPGFTNCVFGKGVTHIECHIDAYVVYPLKDTFGVFTGINTIYGSGSFVQAEIVGGALGQPDGDLVFCDTTFVDGDTILAAPFTTFQNNCVLGSVCVHDSIVSILNACQGLSILTYTVPQLYGTYTLAIGGNSNSSSQGLGSFIYPTTGVSMFKGVPTLELDNTSVGFAEDTSVTPSPRYPNIGLTPAHIDASIGSSGFAGVAHGYHGSFIAPAGFSPGSPTAYVLPSGNGGTGVASPTAHGVLIGEGASPVASVVLGSGQLLVGQASADPQAKTVTGDLAINAAGTATLPTTGVAAGTYGDATNVPQVTVDAKGRVTNATTVAVATGLAANQFLIGSNVSVLGNSTVFDLGSVSFNFPNGTHAWILITFYVTNPDSSPDDILLGGGLNSTSFNLGSPTVTIPANVSGLETGHGGFTHQARIVATGANETVHALAQSNTVGMTVSARIMVMNCA